MSADTPLSRLRFGDFMLDRAGQQLWRRAEEVPLAPKTFAALTLLVENEGRVVSKQRLLDEIWPDTFVLDAVVKVCIAELRRALGETGAEPRHVHTVQRRGYRFEGPVTEVPASSRGRAQRTDEEDATGPPMIGRERELATILQRWEAARGGQGQVLLVHGEAGIGKSRLLQGLREQLLGEPLDWMELHASTFHRNSALHPVVELLRRTFRLEPREPPEAQRARLAVALGRTRLPVTECLPLFAQLLSLPRPPGVPALAASPEVQRRRTLELLCAWLLGLSAKRPLVLVAEDLHWADPSTVELLGMLIDQSRSVPVLLVATHRPEFESPWRDREQVTALPLDVLSRAQVEEMVDRIAAGRPVPRGLHEHVGAYADGVPFFIEELTNSVLELTLVGGGQGGDGADGEPPTFGVPRTLQSLLEARLERLGASKQVAREAAALGREFDAPMLLEVTAATPDELKDGLADLETAGLLTRRGEGAEASYTFRHDLIHETTYQSGSPEERRGQHARIARMLEEGLASRLSIGQETIARHYEEAGMLDEAIGAYDAAGRHATARSAHAEASAHFRSALRLLAGRPEGPERDLCEAGLQVAISEPMVPTLGSGHPEVEAAYARAYELSRSLGANVGLIDALDGLVTFCITQSRLDHAFQLAEQQLEVAERVGEDEYRLRAHLSLALIEYFRGCPARSLAHFEEVDRCFDPVAHREMVTIRGENIGAVSRAWYSWALWIHGHPQRALETADLGVERAHDVGNPWSLAFCLAWSGALHWHCGYTESALGLADECIARFENLGFPIPLGISRLLKMRGEADDRDPDRRVAEAEMVLLQLGAAGAKIAIPQILCGFGGFCLEVGRWDAAKRYLDWAMEHSEQTGQPHWDAEIYVGQGDLVLARSRRKVAAAEELYRRAVATAAEQEARMLELRATTRLAELLARTRRKDEARELLGACYGGFGEGFELPDLLAARDVLERLG